MSAEDNAVAAELYACSRTLRAERDVARAELAAAREREGRLREALKALAAATIGYQNAIYASTGKQYPWPASDMALDFARAALEPQP